MGELGEDEGLFISPCSSVHTLGMSFPLDIVFLDKEARVLSLYHNLKPWRVTRWVPGAFGVLELRAGTLARHTLREGQKVEVPKLKRPRKPKSLRANLLLGSFWFSLAILNIPRLMAGDAGPSGYMLFLVNMLIATLFLTRRKEIRITESSQDRLVTTVCILLSFSLRAMPGTSLVSASWESSLLTLALLLVLAAYLSLGRSFGLIPANRGLKFGGMYRCVRHPLYGAEMLFFASFFLANSTAWNFVLIVGIFFCLHLRALAEERLLASDPTYKNFCYKVRKRYIPFLV